MPSRENVILGIENCLQTDSVTECSRTDCPFIECRDTCLEWLLRSALALLKEQQKPTVSGWISVKDRMPEKTERCMCLCYDFVTKSYWHELLWHENNCWWNSLATLECDYTKHVIYWMPLPEPP
ncbi:MAG: DUF551 domain-containing protein [Selenomonadaceae bacterium]|nr:DUF551 domain-containing protein [Selenomonadaceae bacterium]